MVLVGKWVDRHSSSILLTNASPCYHWAHDGNYGNRDGTALHINRLPVTPPAAMSGQTKRCTGLGIWLQHQGRSFTCLWWSWGNRLLYWGCKNVLCLYPWRPISEGSSFSLNHSRIKVSSGSDICPRMAGAEAAISLQGKQDIMAHVEDALVWKLKAFCSEVNGMTAQGVGGHVFPNGCRTGRHWHYRMDRGDAYPAAEPAQEALFPTFMSIMDNVDVNGLAGKLFMQSTDLFAIWFMMDLRSALVRAA